jgi:hypothetical protein
MRGEAYKGFWWEKPEGKRPLGRPKRRWEDKSKMDLQEVGFGTYIGSSWLRRRTVSEHL